MAADSSGSAQHTQCQGNVVTPGVGGAPLNDLDTAVSFKSPCCGAGGTFFPGGGEVQLSQPSGLPLANVARTVEAWFSSTYGPSQVSSNVQGIVGFGSNATHQAFQLELVDQQYLRVVTGGDDKTF